MRLCTNSHHTEQLTWFYYHRL